MNSIVERFIGSIRRECLDHFLIFSEKQIKKLLTEYFQYFNNRRPHQGLNQSIPDLNIENRTGKILSLPVLGGLHNHYFREAA